MTKRITRRQMEVLRFIYGFTLEHGYSPTMREIATAIGVKSLNTVNDHFIRLVTRGVLKRDKRIARSLVVTEAGRRLVEPAPVGVPDFEGSTEVVTHSAGNYGPALELAARAKYLRPDGLRR